MTDTDTATSPAKWRPVVIRRPYGGGLDGHFLAIHEEHTGSDGSVSITEEAVAAQGDTIEELRESLVRMLKALEAPVKDFDSYGPGSTS